MDKLRHTDEHQSLLCVRKHELLPVIFDGIDPSPGILDAACAATCALSQHLTSFGKEILSYTTVYLYCHTLGKLM